MKTLIDGRPLQTASAQRGIGRYVSQLVQVLTGDPDYSFLFFQTKEHEQRLLAGIPGQVLTRQPRRLITYSDRYFLRRSLRRQSADCYHSTAFALPNRSGREKYILTVHDLTPLLLPRFFPLRQRMIFKRIIASARQADLVLTVSRHTASDLLRFVDIPSERIRTIYNAVDERLQPQTNEAHPVSLPAEYLFYCGGADGSKNLETLLQAAARLSLPLLIAGPISPLRRKALLAPFRPDTGRRFIFCGYVSDSQLAHLYRHAAAFVFPSLNEGFGYPPLEAMGNDTPVVASRAGALEEVLDDAAFYVDNPNNPEEWSIQIDKLLHDSGLRADLIRRGRQRVKRFSMANFARDMKNVYRQLAEI